MHAGFSRRLLGGAVLAGAFAGKAGAQAAPWPRAQPIRVIVPFAAGGATDIAARVISQEMQTPLARRW